MQSGRILSVVISLLLACGMTGCVTSVNHSPGDAAAAASEFVSTLVVDQNATLAFEMTDPGSRPEGFDAARLQDVAQDTPGYGQVTDVVAIEYQPVPGEGAVDIFLEGSSPAGSVYYRVRVLGTLEKGYRPAAFLASGSPFEPDSTTRQPL